MSVPVLCEDADRFNSQVWVVASLQALKEDGVITGNIGYGHLRRELDAELQRWEVAEDTVDERLFP